MKKRLSQTAISLAALIGVAGCAAMGSDLPSTAQSAPFPAPANAQYVERFDTILPLIGDLAAIQPREVSSPGVKRPRKSEMSGDTWKPPFHPDSVYHIPVQTTNSTGTRTVQQVLVSSDLPVGRGSCAHSGFEVVPMGFSVAIAPLPGAPVGTEVSCAIPFGGMMVKVVVTATQGRGISEMRLEGRSRRKKAFPQGVCSDGNYRVSEIIEGGPIGACVIVDASGANSATYVKLQAGAYEMPVVKVGDGTDARLARSSITKLPNGERLVRLQGPHKQVVMEFTNGKRVVLTRGF